MDRQTQDSLFEGSSRESAEDAKSPGPDLAEPPRLRRADRAQVLLRPCSLEELLGPDHMARLVWDLVTRWDLSALEQQIKARGATPGRAQTDPCILLSLWLYAYIKGVSSGRELDELCESDDAYRWLCGGVSLNYHTLNDFRVDHEKVLDDLLTQMIAALTSQGLVKVRRISQDGTRVRAWAGRKSFKTRPLLERHLAEAKAHVAAMKQQAADPKMPLRRQKAAQRAAQQRLSRLEKAISELAKVEAAKAQQKEKSSKHNAARASETDPQARYQRMPGGGTAPAYNVQLAVDTQSRAVVGVDVTNAGSDVHQSQPMRQQVEQRTGQKVEQHLMDGGYVGLDSIENAEPHVTIFAPVPKPKKEGVDPHQPKPGDGPQVGQWRVRMGTEEAKTIYKERVRTSETVNAECKTYRGLGQIMVRGLNKVRCVALLSALAYNIVHFATALRG
jgi:transposase